MSIQSCQRNVVEILKISNQKTRKKDNGPEKIISDLGDENCPSGREGLADDGGLRKGRSQSFSFGSFQKKGGKKGNNCWREKNYCTEQGGGGALSGLGRPGKALWHPRPWSSQVSTFSPWFSESSKLLLLWASLNHTGKFTLMYCWSKFFIPIVYNFLESGLNISSQVV